MSVAKAEQLANHLWQQIGRSIPVDVFQVAHLLNMIVVQQEMEDTVSGMLVINGDLGVVGINDGHHRNRQRFTLAHEIAHFLMHRDASTVFVDGTPVFYRNSDSSEGIYAEEVEANAFAAELLMPKEAIHHTVDGQPIDVFNDIEVWRLADKFQVSVQALTIRLTRLSLLLA